ncbi:peroxisomal ATPase PEX6 [Salvelinus sp. IW2-2015]|uniref:peroxisomal ATPase PEX6 n=1 Tax=Salvelinus sp. IW2-2015 TaxID=2691554 RepID=UPI000CDF7078|nr:peroxisome assembly factor 2 [Salvelinus alpinus]
MAAQVELSCLDTFPTHLNPLHVLVIKSQFRYAFPSCNEPTSTLLFTSRKLQTLGKTAVLLCAHSTEETSGCGADGNDTTLKLYTSKIFLKHYGLQDDIRGVVRPLSPFSLGKVVIGARTRQSFKWANSDKFSNGLLILASCQGQPLLARQGDSLSLPYHPLLGDDISQVQHSLFDLVVLECTPLTQGMITINTTVVVTDCRDIAQHGALETSNPLATRNLTSLFVSDFAHYANSLGGGSSLLDNRQVLDSSLSVFLQALECRLDVRIVDIRRLYGQGRIVLVEKRDAKIDFDSTVFVSKQLLLKLGLFNREWVVVSRFNCSSEMTKTSYRGESLPSPGQADDDAPGKEPSKGTEMVHLGSVVVADFSKCAELDLHDNVGFISPTHWFNLSNGEPVPVSSRAVKIKRWNRVVSQSGLQLSESLSRSASPLLAKELHIDAVISPEYSSHGPFDSILCEHFTIPRLVQLGGVLGIPSEGHPEVLESNSEGITRWPVVYFKVKKVCGSTEEEDQGPYLADTVHTSLYMGGSTNSLAPCSLVGEEPSLWTSLSPPGLSSTVDQFSTIIQPHMNESSAALMSGCTILLLGPSGSGKFTSVRAVCRRLHLHLVKVDCVTLCADTAAACEAKMKSVFQRAEAHRPCILLLRNLQLLGQPRDGTEEDARVIDALCQFIAHSPASVVVVAAVSKPRELSSDVMAAFIHQVSIESPSEEQRRAMLASLSEGMPLGRDVNLARLAKNTAGFLLGDLSALLTQAGKSAHGRILQSCFPEGGSVQEEEDLCACGVTILAQDFTNALETLQDAHSQAIGAPKIPSVRWQDIGGLQQVKREILDTVQLPLERPELLSLGLRRAGLLLYGPPGTGKTLLAKAVATECSMTFLSVKGPELINMYVGQSEENVREVFSKARAAAPCIIFFDELDSLAPNRGRSGDSGGVMDRVVSQLLAELDGLHSSGDVFVIGATNRPDLLDQSLLRPGRFDKLVYVGINEDKESQLQVLKAIVRKFKVDPSVSLQDVVERCPPQLTGADIYALCSDAMMSAIKRKIARVTDGLDTEDTPLILSAEDFNQALDCLKPSVSEQELLKYKLIQQKLTAK